MPLAHPVSRRPALALALLTAVPLAVALPAHAATAPAYTVTALKITTTVASESALGTPATCIVDADLYTPAGVDRAHPAPAILTTNGFGGSKDDQAGLGRAYAAKGYVVLSYSGLGFGSTATTPGSGSGCKITLDDREHDGAAAKQLVDVLAGITKADDGSPGGLVIDDVQKDTGPAHDGAVHPGDIRVGMTGGSYGGEIQFAAAAVDPRIDTIVPLITWNDLAYSLAPNNTSLPGPTNVTYATPGTEKLDWTTLFFSVGFVDGIMATTAQQDPGRLAPCANFADQACLSKAQMDATGYPDQATLDFARNASVETYLDRIRIPTLLGQGQADTLFTLHEAAATYADLRRRGVPVKMIWQQWGHSHGPVPGEFDLAHPDANYEGRVITAWFDHYLKGVGPAPALDFSWYRDWLDKGDAGPAFTSAPSYPLPGTTTLYGSGAALTPTPTGLRSGSATITVPAGGAPLSYTETSALDQSQPVRDVPGATTTLSTGPLAHAVDVVGIPTATLQIASPTAAATQAAGPSGQLVAFVKLYDVAPDGTITLPHRLIAPIRITDVTKPVHVSLPGIVHRFPAGHTLQLAVSLSDAAYKNNLSAQVLTLSTSAARPTTLTLPGRLDLAVRRTSTAPSRAGRPGTPPTTAGSGTSGVGTSGAGSGATGSSGSGSSAAPALPSTGLPGTVPAAAACLLALAAVARRRRPRRTTGTPSAH